MKKSILFLTICAFWICACSDKKEMNDECVVYEGEIGIGEASVMARAYQAKILRAPDSAIQQINMDAASLRDITKCANGIRFIGAVADKDSTTLLVELYDMETKASKYYDIRRFFNPKTMPSMRGKPVLCPPPPGCDLPMVGTTSKENQK